MQNPRTLSDEALLSQAHSLCGVVRKVDVQLIGTLMEVANRRLYLRMACSSMWDFCQRKLHMSEGQSYRRLTAARLVRDIPELLGAIERGEVTLSGLTEVKDVITPANAKELLLAIFGKNRAQVAKLVAAINPKPDVPTTVRKLPTPAPTPTPTPSGLVAALAPSAAGTLAGVDAPPAAAAQPLSAPLAARPRIEPLSPERYKLQMTLSGELLAKVERARDLMQHRNPSGDIVVVLEAAIDSLLRDLESSRLGALKREEKNTAALRAATAAKQERTATGAEQPTSAKLGRGPAAPYANALRDDDEAGDGAAMGEPEVRRRAIPRAARRAVFARDGEQCTYVSADGQRCPARTFLELDHITSWARGGAHEAENLCVVCHAHNKLHAESDFGRQHIAEQIHFRQQQSATRHEGR